MQADCAGRDPCLTTSTVSQSGDSRRTKAPKPGEEEACAGRPFLRTTSRLVAAASRETQAQAQAQAAPNLNTTSKWKEKKSPVRHSNSSHAIRQTPAVSAPCEIIRILADNSQSLICSDRCRPASRPANHTPRFTAHVHDGPLALPPVESRCRVHMATRSVTNSLWSAVFTCPNGPSIGSCWSS